VSFTGIETSADSDKAAQLFWPGCPHFLCISTLGPRLHCSFNLRSFSLQRPRAVLSLHRRLARIVAYPSFSDSATMTKMRVLFLVLAISAAQLAIGAAQDLSSIPRLQLDNGLGSTPPMG
jgi:hypothetical protein